MSKDQLLVLINKCAGHGLSDNFERLIHEELKNSKFEYKIKHSEHPGHLTKLAEDGVNEGVKIILIAGGDGSVNEVIKSLHSTTVKLGIIPIGSGNGLARHLKIPLNIQKAIQIVKKGNTKLIDAASINRQPFISIAGTGFDALIAKHFLARKSRGFWSYLKLVLKYYFGYKPLDYEIFHNDIIINKKALMICFANSDQFGNNLSIAPQAVINDGYIDVCIVQKPPVFDLPFTLIKLLFKRVNKSKHYQSFKTQQIRIKGNHKMLINIDGEYFDADQEIEVKIIPKAVHIFVP